MNILLVYPYFLEKRLHTEDVGAVPIGLYYVAALLKDHGHDVEILDWHQMDRHPGAMEEAIREKKPDVMGFSVLQANRWGAIEIARLAKKVNPGITTVFGGVSPTFLWEHFLKNFPEIDFIVTGEGEYPFLHLVQWRELGKKEEELPTIPGLAYRAGRQILRNDPGPPLQDLDALPDPAEYFTFQHIASSRGCPRQCVFCGSPRFWHRTVRFHSVDYFVSQIEKLHRKGVSFFYVSDDTFTMKKRRVVAICKTILERKIPISWAAICRVSDVDEEILYWMRKAGCVQVSYGVESGSEKIRRFLNKEITTPQILKAFSSTVRMGILPRAYFIYGNPGETEKTIQETIHLMVKIRPLSAIFYILDIFPGTALYERYKKATGATDDIWLERMEDIMYFETDPCLKGEDVLAFGKRLRQTFHKALPEFAGAAALVDRKDLYPLHADFCSRLALTFTNGDYAQVEEIPAKDQIAEKLYALALGYHPDHRAYLGLGVLLQRKGEYERSVQILQQGLSHFPSSEQLHMCLGISHMNLGRFREALSGFEKFKDAPGATRFIAACKQALEK
jgi:radical SAM superfamily enzyme YgiQ (UPF0313 family)